MTLNKQTYITCGSFDSVHIGHQKLINELIKQSKQDNAISVVILLADTNLHSKQFVYTYEERKYILKKMGVDIIELYKFDDINYSKFIKKYFLEKYHATKFFTGQYDNENIVDICNDIEIKIDQIYPKKYNNTTVTTDMVVHSIKEDDFNLMYKLLNHNYVVYGEIVHGKGQGRKFGMPTANLRYSDKKILPPHGVYAAIITIRGEKFRGFTNVGLRPSADNMNYISVETYILDFDRDIYGENVAIELVQYVRPVMKFPGGLADVKKQVDQDIQAVRKLLS